MTRARIKAIEDRAAELLEKANAYQTPVPIDRICRYLSLKVRPVDLGDEVSGVLVVSGAGGEIGYNASQHAVRQRFTVAHEIGHFVLHHAVRALFIDKKYAAVYKRDQSSSQGEQLLEIEANRFAAALLLPRGLVLDKIRAYHLDLGSETGLRELADLFSVSTQALSIRLAQLRILPDYS